MFSNTVRVCTSMSPSPMTLLCSSTEICPPTKIRSKSPPTRHPCENGTGTGQSHSPSGISRVFVMLISAPALSGARQQRHDLEHQRRGRQRCRLGVVVGGRDLHDIRADDPQIAER